MRDGEGNGDGEAGWQEELVVLANVTIGSG